MLIEKLSEHDLEIIVPVFIRAIMKRNCKEKAVTAGEMCKGFAKHNEKMNSVKIRSIVNYLRNLTGTADDPFPNAFICSCGNGYWLEHRASIILREANHLIERENAIRTVKEAAFRKARIIESQSQMRLF